MTTDSIRKSITVADFNIYQGGININYEYNLDERSIHLGDTESCEALKEAGIIEDWKEGFFEPFVTVEGEEILWREYIDKHGIWQYAAILLVVNYEMKRFVGQMLKPFQEVADIVNHVNA